jgi:predicted permease
VPTIVHYGESTAVRSGLAEYTTASYLTTLGLSPALGRWFDQSEDVRGAPVVVVLGHRAWTRRFNADHSVIGRTIHIEGTPATIVGVAPAGHNATVNLGIVTDFWLPISALPALGVPSRMLERRPEESAFFVKARLKDGVTVPQARAVMSALGERLKAEYPTEDPGAGISVYPSKAVRIHPQLDFVLQSFALVLLTIVALVLAIACSNLATLLLVRGAARAKEISTRLALGASRVQIVRLLLTESLLLSLAGGAAGCLLAWWAIRFLGAVELPIQVDVALDYRVLAFALGISVLTGLTFGLAPALNAARIDLLTTLRGEASTIGDRLFFRNGLVALQVTLSVLLLGGASMVLQVLGASRIDRAGFAVDGVAMLQTDPRYAGYSGAQGAGVVEEFHRRIRATAGVESAALAYGLPMQTTGVPIFMDDEALTDRPRSTAQAIWAGPGYFDTLRIPILYGRALDDRDRADTPRVAVVSERMARAYFGEANAVGQRFRLQSGDTIEVVGIAKDTGTADLQDDLVNPGRHLFYRSFVQWNLTPDAVIARSPLPSASLVGSMQQELRRLDAALPVLSAQTMEQYLKQSLVTLQVAAVMLVGLGAVGVGLATIGLYAIVAYAVSRRTREIGIRVALGARRAQVIWAMTRPVAVVLGLGTLAGLGLSVLVIEGLRGAVTPAPGITLYQPAVQPLALLAIAMLMALVGVAAAYVPARRITAIHPASALRHE